MSEKSFFGHPMGLSTLFATEFWERFSYYGMRALLVLTLTATLANGGFGLDEYEALEIYGIFTGLVYVTPILGGILADKLLGQRKSIYIGGITMALGQFALAYSTSLGNGVEVTAFQKMVFYSGLGILIMGNGYFKPNISTIVGGLYAPEDTRRDSAFTIFYMGINAGAFLAPLVAGSLGENVAWEYGYLAAGVGMLLGTFWFYFREETLKTVGLPPKAAEGSTRIVFKDWRDIIIWSVLTTVVVVGFIEGFSAIPDTVQTWIYWIVGIGSLVALLYIIATNTEGKTEWSRVGVIFVLALFNIVFWSGFEQAGGTFNIFARDMTDRTIGDWTIPASYFQSINAIAIFIFAPIFSVLWTKLAKVGKNPRTPVKFSLGLLLLSAGFFVMAAADGATKGGTQLVSPMWLVMVYLMHTWGELCLSPIGLSMITKLSPAKIVSVMMGVWMGSIAIGNFLAASMKKIVDSYDLPLYEFIGFEVLGAAVILLLLSPILNKLMKGIH